MLSLVDEELTWTIAVEMIKPVPNCFSNSKTMLEEVSLVKRTSRTGPKTAIAH